MSTCPSTAVSTGTLVARVSRLVSLHWSARGRVTTPTSVHVRLMVLDPTDTRHLCRRREPQGANNQFGRLGTGSQLCTVHSPKTQSPMSGRPDWRNAVRNLWIMEYEYPPNAKPREMSEDRAVLLLECEKRNYGPKPPNIYLDRENGVLTERRPPDWVAEQAPLPVTSNGARNYDDAV